MVWLENLPTDKEQTDNQKNRQFKNLGHSNPLWIVGGAGQQTNKQTVQTLRPL